MICRTCGEDKKHEANGLCKICYMREWHIKNKKKIEACGSSVYNEAKKFVVECIDCGIKYKSTQKNTIRCKSCHVKFVHERNPVCTILKKHHEEMKDDPESLSTEFIQDIIGVKC